MSTSPPIPDPDSDWSVDEIEQAYQRALEVFDEGAGEVLAEPLAEPVTASAQSIAAETTVAPEATVAPETTLDSDDRPLPAPEAAPLPASAMADLEPSSPLKTQPTPSAARQTLKNVSGTSQSREPSSSAEAEQRVSPTQVIEAALFVGGAPLSAGKLYALLRGTISVEQVPLLIDELNTLYAAQGRPYEIRLGDGGYRLELRQEFERLKQRVFGQGPREVRLAQDVLEVLALVAYRQPLAEADFEKYGKGGVGNILRQLLRRDLIQIERGENGPKDVRYRTTERFLSVFGIGNLSELPHPEDLAVR